MNNQKLTYADRRLFLEELINEYNLNVDLSEIITYISKKTSATLIKWGKKI